MPYLELAIRDLLPKLLLMVGIADNNAEKATIQLGTTGSDRLIQLVEGFDFPINSLVIAGDNFAVALLHLGIANGLELNIVAGENYHTDA